MRGWMRPSLLRGCDRVSGSDPNDASAGASRSLALLRALVRTDRAPGVATVAEHD